jgi:hypothetical protein
VREQKENEQNRVELRERQGNTERLIWKITVGRGERQIRTALLRKNRARKFSRINRAIGWYARPCESSYDLTIMVLMI